MYAMKGAFPYSTLHLLPAMFATSLNPHIMSWPFGSKYSGLRNIQQLSANVLIQEAENNFGKGIINKIRNEIASEQEGADPPATPGKSREQSPLKSAQRPFGGARHLESVVEVRACALFTITFTKISLHQSSHHQNPTPQTPHPTPVVLRASRGARV